MELTVPFDYQAIERILPHRYPFLLVDRITEFEGRGRDGPVQMLFIETRRRDVPLVTRRARTVDPECFYIVDDVRVASARSAGRQIGGLASILKGK